MDIELFLDMLKIDSTSGREGAFADWIAERFSAPGREVRVFDIKNVLVSWGKPKVVFCTHLDTVPPYISPSLEGGKVCGRGSCDAKGQIFSMYEACRQLEAEGYDGFALLLLTGEETGSFGAKDFTAMADEVFGGYDEDRVVVVGEPTDNCMATAAKGTKAFEVSFTGEAFHSGYPEYGCSAIMLFNDFINALRSVVFPKDEILGSTTWNVGKLISDNPQNILSDKLTCRVYFRTTFESDQMVCNLMKNIAGPQAKLRFGRPKVQDGSDIVAKEVAPWQQRMEVKALGGDTPSSFEVLPGFPVKSVSFGSDAPQLTCFKRKMLCGPGSILVAHRDEEHVMLSDIETAINNYIAIYNTIIRP